jgi:hypothetical protein
MTNQNCLAGIRCPKCKQEDEFLIEATQMMRVHDDGCEGHGDIEWDDNSYCCCSECDHDGELREFRIDQ